MGRERKKREANLTLEEVALVVDGLVETLGDEGAKRLGEVIRTDPRFSADIEVLEKLAREAGLQPDGSFEYLSAAHALHEALAMLLATDGWRHPAEILDPDGSCGIPYAQLIRLARKREGKSGDEEAATILEVRQRLEKALAAEMAEESLVERFVAGLLDLPQERAVLLLAQAERQYDPHRSTSLARDR
jgi:hypothetical protein